MKPKHKYFRNQRYKNSLERKYNNGYNESYPSNIVFLTEEQDSRAKREATWWCSYDFKKKTRYIYYAKPEVPYTIKEEHHKPCKVKRFFKKYSNRVVRRTKDIYKGRSYKKVFDLWWTLF
jgi:hypothetical protein